MGWPNNYVQGGLPASYELADSLGFLPNAADNTAAFAAYKTYLNTTPTAKQKELWLRDGTYYATKIIIAASEGIQVGVNGCTAYDHPMPAICGSGKRNVFIKPLPSSEEVFIVNERGGILDMKLVGLSIVGIGATNPLQKGMMLRTSYDTRISAGPLSGLYREDCAISGFDGEQVELRSAVTAYIQNMPQQAIIYNGIYDQGSSRPLGNHLPTEAHIGQKGQYSWIGHNYANGSSRTNNLGSNLYFGVPYDFSTPAPQSVTANVFTLQNIQQILRSGRKIRAVNEGASVLPAEISTGTDYKYIQTDIDKIYLYTIGTESTSGSGTNQYLIAPEKTVTTIGTVGWKFVAQWITGINLGTSVVTFGQQNTSVDGDAIAFVGKNLPTATVNGSGFPLAISTPYYARPVTQADNTASMREFKLYSTLAGALAGGTTDLIVFTATGTLTDFGVRSWGVDGLNCLGAIKAELGYVSCAHAEIALEANTAATVIVEPYFEHFQTASLSRTNATITYRGGILSNCGDGSNGFRIRNSLAKGVVNSAIRDGVINLDKDTLINGARDYDKEEVNGKVNTPDGYDAGKDVVSAGVNTITYLNSGIYNGQLALAAELSIGSRKVSWVAGGATVVTNIKTKLQEGDLFVIKCQAGNLTFNNTVGLNLNGLSNLTLAPNQIAVFMVGDVFFNKIELVSHTVTKSLSYTVAGLPAAATVGAGHRAVVTDALAPAYLAAVAGGGAVICSVMSNGTAWIVS